MWKKRISLLMVMVLSLSLFALAGCSSDKEEPAAAEPAPAVEQISEEEVLQQAAMDYFNFLPEGSNLIKPDKASTSLDSYYIMDIRSPEAYAEGHVPGAVNVPMAKMGEEIPNLPTDKPLLVYCYSGQSAGQTVGVLKMAGFEAYSMTSGFNNGWAKADPALPVEK